MKDIDDFTSGLAAHFDGRLFGRHFISKCTLQNRTTLLVCLRVGYR